MGRFWRRAAAGAVVAAAMVAGGATGASAAQDSGGTWSSYTRPAQYTEVTDKDVPITMSDGTVLRANIAHPDAPGRFPVLITQTP
jgi:predicted acyl esterase